MEGKFPGQRLVERLETRTRRRPRIGMSPAFYLRYGVPDPWLDTPLDGDLGRLGQEFTLVSASAYYKMMQRLAMSRVWRERRYTQASSRWAGSLTLERRRFPGELAAPKSLLGRGPTVSSNLDFVMPQAWAPEPAVQPEAAVSGGRKPSRAAPRGRKEGWYRRPVPESLAPRPARERLVERAAPPLARAIRAASPALQGLAQLVPGAAPAPGAAPTAAEATGRVSPRTSAPMQASATPRPPTPEPAAPRLRPAERVGVRAQEAQIEAAPLLEVLERAGISRARARRVVVEVEARGGVERVVEVRRVLRQALRAREVEAIAESLPDPVSEPSRLAAGRAPAPGGRARGLRPVMASSPAMQVVAPEELPAGPAPATPSRRAAPPAAWASARAEERTALTLSQSPVRAPSAPPRDLPQALAASPLLRERAPLAPAPLAAEEEGATTLAARRLDSASTPRKAWRVAAPALDMVSVQPTEPAAASEPTRPGWSPRATAPKAAAPREGAAASAPARKVGPAAATARVAPPGEPATATPPRLQAREGGADATAPSGPATAPSGPATAPAAPRALRRRALPPAASARAMGRLAELAPARAALLTEEPQGPRGRTQTLSPALAPALRREQLESLLSQPEQVAELLARSTEPSPVDRARPARASRAALPGGELAVLRPTPPEATPPTAGAPARRARPLPQGLGTAAVREPGGRFVAAKQALEQAARPTRRDTPRLERPPTPVEGDPAPLALRSTRSLAARWAAERLDTAQAQTPEPLSGLSPRLRSLLPRTARVPSAAPVLLTAGSVEEAEELAVALRRALPQANVTVSRVARRAEPAQAGLLSAGSPAAGSPSGGSPSAGPTWGSAAWDPSFAVPAGFRAVLEGQVSAAAARLERLPLTGYTAARATQAAGSGPARGAGPMGWAHTPLLSLLLPQWAAAEPAPDAPAGRRLPVAPARATRATRARVDYTPLAFGPTQQAETPAGVPVRARQVRLPQGQLAHVAAPRPLDWVDQRVGVAQTSAYRGAFGAPGAPLASAGVGGAALDAPGSLASQRAERALGGGGTHRAAALPDMRLPPSFTGQPEAAGAEGPVHRAARPAVFSTLGQVAGGELPPSAPSWADRSVRATRIHTVGELVDSLARATDPGQVIRIIAQDGSKVRASSGLPAPMLELMKQIGSETRAVEAQASQARAAQVQTSHLQAVQQTRGAAQPEAQHRQGQGVRTSTRVLRGFTGLRTQASARTGNGVGEDRVMGLVRKLQNLIHLAENQNRLSDAQRQVRLAATGAPSDRAGIGETSSADAGEKQNVDIEALAREVMEAVNRELEQRRERRPEDSDVNVWW